MTNEQKKHVDAFEYWVKTNTENGVSILPESICKDIIAILKDQEIIRCGECIYYDPPHVENNGVRYEYTEMPADAFDVLGTGLVTTEYGINVGGRCCRDYNAGYDDDKRVFVTENNYCGRAERRTDDRTDKSSSC